MKNTFTLLFIFILTLSFSQESFKRTYKIPLYKVYSSDSIFLKKTVSIKFEKLTKNQQDTIREMYKEGSTILYIKESKVSGENVQLNISELIDSNFYSKQFMDSTYRIKRKRIRGTVKFDKNKIYINPELLKGDNGKLIKNKDIYYYKLDNRQSMRLNFEEVTISTFAIPIKYRLKNSSSGLEEEFTSSFNVNLFGGYSWGKTSFFHKKEVGNKTNTWKFTIGILFGVSTVELNNLS